MTPVHLIGAPLDLGGGRRGVDMGPSALRIAGLGEQIAALGRAALPVVLGGDHSVAAGSIAASAEAVRARTAKPLGVIWVDAHGDMNTPATSESGNVHGMPLAALLGQEPAELASIGSTPSVMPLNTVLVGIR